MAAYAHLDDMTGALARLLQVLRPPARNTLDRLGAYEGKRLDELFPAPQRVPVVQCRARWQLPGLVSEDLSFASLHEPLEPEFNRYYWPVTADWEVMRRVGSKYFHFTVFGAWL